MYQQTGAAACIRWVVLVFCIAATGCATGKLNRARDQFYDGRFSEAAGTLSRSEDFPKRDRLLYYMEKGVILHETGDYRKSAETLLEAARFIEEQRISISREGGSLVTSEWLTVYMGEYAERLLIHTYLMMNYLLLDAPEDAYVEARRALQVIDEYPNACRKDYFTRALIAHCFQAVGEINSAYIEYRKLAADLPDPGPLLPKLYRLARILGFHDEAGDYARKLPPEAVRATLPPAEAVIFISQGRGPVKEPRNIILPPSIRFSFIQYERRDPYYPVGIESLRGPVVFPRVTTDMASLLKASVNERAARIIAKETARVTAKEAIANNIEDPTAELLVRIAFFLSEEPDTRGWQTLPAYLTLAAVPLDRGIHSLTVTDYYGRIELPPVGGGSRRQYHYFSVRPGIR